MAILIICNGCSFIKYVDFMQMFLPFLLSLFIFFVVNIRKSVQCHNAVVYHCTVML